MEKSGAHRCALPAKFKPGNGDFDRSPPALHPPFYGAAGGGQRRAAMSMRCNQLMYRQLIKSQAAVNQRAYLTAVCRSIPSALAIEYAVSPLVARWAIFWRSSSTEFRSPNSNAVSLRSRHACFCPLANLLCLNLCQRRQQREQDVSDQLVIGRQMRLGITVKCDVVG